MCYVCAMNMDNFKTCIKCKTEKNIENFHTNRTKKDGKNTVCKECVLKEWRKPKKDEIFID